VWPKPLIEVNTSAGFLTRQLRITKAAIIEVSRRKRLDHSIGARQQAAKRRGILLATEIERNRALVGVHI